MEVLPTRSPEKDPKSPTFIFVNIKNLSPKICRFPLKITERNLAAQLRAKKSVTHPQTK
jgi:hypothetical protein